MAANQSDVTDLEKNDLQVGMGTADNTGSNIEFANGALEHANGLAIINFIAKQGPECYYYDGDTYNWTTKTGTASTVRAASTNIVTYYPSSDFSGNIPYTKSDTQYMAIVKPSQNTTFQSNAIRSWSLSYNVARNDKKSQDVNIHRDGKNLGWVYSYTGKVQTFNTPEAGTYKMECWGASGGDIYGTGGRGAYTSGVLNIIKFPLSLYIYVGNHPTGYEIVFNGSSGYNIGSANVYCNPAGGATDIRLTGGDWKGLESRKSRIMVAASGGSAYKYNISIPGGDAGGVKSYNTYYTYDVPSGLKLSINPVTDQSGILDKTMIKDIGQLNVTVTGYNPDFGTGERTGVGSGYYSGIYYGHHSTVYGGMGGVCFVSGYDGCKAISPSFTDDNHVMLDTPNHYSGYVFANGIIKSGRETMPSPVGGTETGHTGNGYAIITQSPN